MNEWFLRGFFLSICCWPLSETGGWACWTRALVSNKCYFLKNFENPLFLWSRGEEGGGPAWLGCCNASSCNLQTKHLCCLVLPLFTRGLVAAHRSWQPRSPIPWTSSGKQLWQMVCSSIVLMCQRISVEMGGCCITLLILKENWKLCREMIRGSLHTTLETKCLVLSLTLQSCLCLSQRFWFFCLKGMAECENNWIGTYVYKV